MADLSNKWTEERLQELEQRIYDMYSESYKDLGETITEYFQKFEKRDAEMKALLDAGEITEQKYTDWRLAQMARGKHFQLLQEKVAERMTGINEVAMAYINDETPGVYSLNYNFENYKMGLSYDGAFEALPEAAIRRLAVDNPAIMPFYPEERAIARGIDLAFGRQQIAAKVKSGLIRGLSVYQIADNLQSGLQTMNRASAIRTARTAVTSAQNGGRQAAFENAAKMGIQQQKKWRATHDMRTRHAHRMLDGEIVPYDQPFTAGGAPIMFPGDPSAPPAMVYNCRCTLQTGNDIELEAEPHEMRVRDPVTGRNIVVTEEGFEEWKQKNWGDTANKAVQTTSSNETNLQAARSIYGNRDGMKYNVSNGDSVTTQYERRVNKGGKWESEYGDSRTIEIPKNNSDTEVLVQQLPEGKQERLDWDATKNTILSNGRIAVNYNSGNNDTRIRVKSMIENEIAVLGGVREDGVFYRVTHNPKDAEYIRKGTIRPSVNHMTGEKEDGLSVWEIPKYWDTYLEKLRGDVVGIGSDGEPLLDVKTVKLIGVDGMADEVKEKLLIGRELFKKKYGWTEKQLERALTGNFTIRR